jgi:hypothetical protein
MQGGEELFVGFEGETGRGLRGGWEGRARKKFGRRNFLLENADKWRDSA